MESIISGAGLIFTNIVDQASTVGTTIVGTPLLLLFAVSPVAFWGIRMFKRLIHAGRG